MTTKEKLNVTCAEGRHLTLVFSQPISLAVRGILEGTEWTAASHTHAIWDRDKQEARAEKAEAENAILSAQVQTLTETIKAAELAMAGAAIAHRLRRDATDLLKVAADALGGKCEMCGGRAERQERDEAAALRRDAELWRAIANQDLAASRYGQSAPFIHPGFMAPISRECWALVGDDAAKEVARTLIQATEAGG